MDAEALKTFSAWFFNNPTTALAVLVVGWHIKKWADAILKELAALNDPDKTTARMKPVMQEQANVIIREIGHDTRAALQPVMTVLAGRRDG